MRDILFKRRSFVDSGRAPFGSPRRSKIDSAFGVELGIFRLALALSVSAKHLLSTSASHRFDELRLKFLGVREAIASQEAQPIKGNPEESAARRVKADEAIRPSRTGCSLRENEPI